jgi:hypothetical protein
MFVSHEAKCGVCPSKVEQMPHVKEGEAMPWKAHFIRM